MLSVWRKLLYKELSEVELDGEILDLGGSIQADYHSIIKGHHNITAANLDKGCQNDLLIDLEKKFPIDGERYDAITCINVLEHIFDYNNLLSESHRVLKSGGLIVISTPFIFQRHPCPNDYWRYTKECLQKILENNGFGEIAIKEIGRGVFTATGQVRQGIYKINCLKFFSIYLNLLLDKILWLIFKKDFLLKNYPIGYLTVAKKI